MLDPCSLVQRFQADRFLGTTSEWEREGDTQRVWHKYRQRDREEEVGRGGEKKWGGKKKKEPFCVRLEDNDGKQQNEDTERKRSEYERDWGIIDWRKRRKLEVKKTTNVYA